MEKVRQWQTFSIIKPGEFAPFRRELPGLKFIMRITAFAATLIGASRFNCYILMFKQKTRTEFKVLLFIAFTAWLAHFLNFRHFGFYEDDYAHIIPVLEQDWSFFPQLFLPLITWFQGRPVSYSLLRLFPFLGDHLGGLPVIYLVGFLLICCNAYLVYRLLKLLQPEFAAIIGALAFCLFPSDGAKILLTNLFVAQSAIGFLLIASLCYLRGNQKISYFFAACALLSYETAFIVCFGIPLLQPKKWNRVFLKELGKHAVILIGIFIVVLLIRRWTGEGGDPRVANMMENFFSNNILLRIFLSPLIGITATLSMYGRVPLGILTQLFKHESHNDNHILLICLVFLCVSSCIFSTIKFEARAEASDQLSIQKSSLSSQSTTFPIFNNVRQLLYTSTNLRLLLTGLILLGLSYILVVRDPYFPPSNWLSGRLSSGAHMSATVGASVIFAAIAAMVLPIFNSWPKRAIATTVLSLYLSLFVGYFYTIQLEFRQSWDYQRSFWSSVVNLCPDIAPGTVVLVHSKGLPKTSYIGTNSWADFLVLQNLYESPPEIPKPYLFTARLLRKDQLREEFQWEGDQLIWNNPGLSFLYPDGKVVLPKGNVILLKRIRGKLGRVEGSIFAAGKPFSLKSKSTEAPFGWTKGVLAGYLLIPNQSIFLKQTVLPRSATS